MKLLATWLTLLLGINSTPPGMTPNTAYPNPNADIHPERTSPFAFIPQHRDPVLRAMVTNAELSFEASDYAGGKKVLEAVLEKDATNLHALLHLYHLALDNPSVCISDLQSASYMYRIEQICADKCLLEVALRSVYDHAVQWNSKRKVGAADALKYLQKLAALESSIPPEMHQRLAHEHGAAGHPAQAVYHLRQAYAAGLPVSAQIAKYLLQLGTPEANKEALHALSYVLHETHRTQGIIDPDSVWFLSRLHHDDSFDFNMTDLHILRDFVTLRGWHPDFAANNYQGTTVEDDWEDGKIPYLRLDPARPDWTRLEEYVQRRSPVIVTGLPGTSLVKDVLGWKTGQWTVDYLKEKVGALPIIVDVQDRAQAKFGTGNSQYRQGFGSFLDDLEEPLPIKYLGLRADEKAYQPPLDTLLGDVPAPGYFAAYNKSVISANLWMGGSQRQHAAADLEAVQARFPRSTAMLHVDAYQDNLNVLLKGSKEFLLFGPSDALNVYTLGHISEVTPSGQLKFTPQRNHIKEVSFNFCMVDPEAPDLATFPRFSQTHPTRVVLEADQMLYIPAGWFHQVKTTHPSRAVNHWFATPHPEEANEPPPPPAPPRYENPYPVGGAGMQGGMGAGMGTGMDERAPVLERTRPPHGPNGS